MSAQKESRKDLVGSGRRYRDSECSFVKGPSWGVVLMCLDWMEGFGHFPVCVTEEGKGALYLCCLIVHGKYMVM